MKHRLDALRARITAAGCDGFVSVHPAANQYLSGFLTSLDHVSSVIVVTAAEAHFLCDSRYTEQAQREVRDLEITQITGDQMQRGGELLGKLGIKRAAFDPNGHTVAEHGRLAAGFGGELVPDDSLVTNLRLRKEDCESDAIRAASQLAEGVLLDVLPSLREGVAEREIAAEIEYEFKRRGCSGTSFSTIVLFGANSSLPHGVPGERRLKPGDAVLIDMGCRRGGYCSDLTRTFVFSSIPGPWFEEVYSLTRRAQLAALDAIRPGVTGREVDAVARGIITEGGHGERFGHGLGHGVGIEIHEEPRLNTRSDTVLEPGMVVTVEPGIYLPGQGGVRIEDLVLVTESGCEVFTQTSKELKVL
jgi:Xaa-Pro aminopeptidase